MFVPCLPHRRDGRETAPHRTAPRRGVARNSEELATTSCLDTGHGDDHARMPPCGDGRGGRAVAVLGGGRRAGAGRSGQGNSRETPRRLRVLSELLSDDLPDALFERLRGASAKHVLGEPVRVVMMVNLALFFEMLK